jgi:DNA-binding transcriptional MerR regulator
MGPQEVVRSTGVSASTLRHYERLGLLLNVRRNQSGYRRYPQTVVNRVLLIQRALAIGFSLADVRRVLSVRDKGGAPCQGVRALVAARLGDVDRQIAELHELRAELGDLLAQWDIQLAQTPSGQPAHLLEGLANRPAIERQRASRKGKALARFCQV